MIGLSIAYALAREGIRPTVLDRRELGREASWAGAGLIPPVAERSADESQSAGRAAVLEARLYPDWSAALQEETGIDTGYRRTGGVDVAWTDREDQALRPRPASWRAEGIAYERLAPGDFARVEPALNPELAAVYYPARPRPGPQSPAPPGLDGGGRPARRPARALARRRGLRGRRRPGDGGPDQRGRASVRPGGRGGRSLVGPVARDDSASARRRRRSRGRSCSCEASGRCSAASSSTARTTWSPARTAGSWSGPPRRTPASTPVPDRSESRDLLDEALRLCPVLREAEVEATWAGLRPGSIDTQALHRPGPRLRQPDRRHRTQTRRLAARPGHRRARRRPGPRPPPRLDSGRSGSTGPRACRGRAFRS